MTRSHARLGLGAATLIGPVAILMSCGEGERVATGVARDALAEVSSMRDVTLGDAGEEPGPIVDCTSTFELSPGCVHPQVKAECSGGWCRIPKGCSVMGSPRCEFGRGAYDEDEVQIRLTHDFEIGAHETTQAEWEASGFVNHSVTDAAYTDCASPSCPVGNVTWFDALAFANRLSARHVPALPDCYRFTDCVGEPGNGMVCARAETTVPSAYDCTGFRLPSEAEWEYAVRAGTRTPIYSGAMTSHPFGHCTLDPNLAAIAWYCVNGGTSTHPVEGLAPNAWGIHDMIGNTDEWIADVFNGLGYQARSLVNPGGALGDGKERVTRGGLIGGPSEICRSASRQSEDWSVRGPGLGFRLVRSLD